MCGRTRVQIPVLAFFAFTPYAVLDFKDFVRDDGPVGERPEILYDGLGLHYLILLVCSSELVGCEEGHDVQPR